MNGQSTHRTHTQDYTPQPLMSLTTHPTYKTRSVDPTQARPPYIYLHQTQPFTHPLTEPPNDETRQISKQYFKFIQATHHKHIIDKAITMHVFPPGMMRQVNRLTDFIKPAAPTEHTRTKVAENTTTWMQKNMIILQEHYSSTISSLNNTPKDPLALQIAIGWARKRYGQRLTPETIHTVEHTLGIYHHNYPPATRSPPPPPSRPTVTRPENPLPPILEAREEEDFPSLPKSQAPHKLSLYLGPRSSLAEQISLHQRQNVSSAQHTLPTQTMATHHPMGQLIKSISEAMPTQASRLEGRVDQLKPSPTCAQESKQPEAATGPYTYSVYAWATQKTPIKHTGSPPTATRDPGSKQQLGQQRQLSLVDAAHTQSPQQPRNQPPKVIQPPTQIQMGPPEKPRQPPEDTNTPASPPLNTSTPLPQRVARLPSHKRQKDAQGTQLTFPNSQLSPILPTVEKTTITHCTSLPPVSPQQPPEADKNPPSHTQPHGIPPTKLGGILEVEAQVHVPPKVQQTTNLDLESITLSKSGNNSNVSVITHDTISSFCLSSADRAGGRPDSVGQRVSFNHTKQSLSEGGLPMMSGTQKANMAVPRAQSEPSTQLVWEAALPDRPVPVAGASGVVELGPPERLGSPLASVIHPQPWSTPSPATMFKPAYHLARPHRKLQDWAFRPRKPVLILGDSNINRIPSHTNPKIQLESYPGANLYHFLKICEKTPVNPSTKILVLSVGLNNKEQDPKQTSIKQLKALYRQARTTFPNADIYFPIMNVSPHFTSKQQENLKLINNTIATHFPFLAEIPHDTFTTEADNIHWTASTARKIFQYWCEQLNL